MTGPENRCPPSGRSPRASCSGSCSESAGGHRRTFRLTSIDIDETDMHAGEGLAALHVHGIGNQARAVGQMAAIPAVEGAGDLDILDRVVVSVAEREGDKRFRTEPAPAPGWRAEPQPIEREPSH